IQWRGGPPRAAQPKLSSKFGPFTFMGGCKEKAISGRGAKGRGETTREALPDGGFKFTLEGGSLPVGDDSPGDRDYQPPATIDFFGQAHCDRAKPDAPVVEVEVLIWPKAPALKGSHLYTEFELTPCR